MHWYTKTMLVGGVGLLLNSCLPEGKPPQQKDTLDTLIDTVTEKGSEDIKTEMVVVPRKDSSEYVVEIKPDTTIYDTAINEQELDIPIYDGMAEELEVKTWFDFSPPETLLDIVSLDEKQETKTDTFPILTPYQPDENTLVLLHFDEPNSLENLGIIPINVEDYGTTQTPSLEGFGQARYFDGVSYLELKKEVGLGLTNSLTIEALVKPTLPQDSFTDDFGNIVANVGQAGVIFMKDHYVAGALGLITEVGYEYLYVELWNYDLPINKFTHVALTYDGSKIKLYVDKKQKDEVTISGVIAEEPDKNTFIGWNVHNGFIGAIDEVRISNVAREF